MALDLITRNILNGKNGKWDEERIEHVSKYAYMYTSGIDPNVELIYQKRQKIREKLGESFEDVFKALDGCFPHEKTARLLAEMHINHHSKEEDLLKYYILGERLRDEEYPTTPYFNKHYTKVLDVLDEGRIAKLEKQWIEEQNKYKASTGYDTPNVLYMKDYMKEWVEMTKHPVIGSGTIAYFLEKLYFRIQKSHTELKIEPETFMQTMFGFDRNGKLTRFVKVLEILPEYKVVDGQKQVVNFDWNISIKVMPDRDIRHASQVFRIESKKAKHKNIFGSKSYQDVFQFAREEDKNDSFYFRKMLERLYKTNENDAHIHVFDRPNQLMYIKRPNSCNVIPFHHLISCSTQPYNDMSAFTPFMLSLMGDASRVEHLEALKEKLDLSNRQVAKDRDVKRKEGWFTKFSCLRFALSLVDATMNIEKEAEWNIVDRNLRIFIDEAILTMDEYVEELQKQLRKQQQDLRLNKARKILDGNMEDDAFITTEYLAMVERKIQIEQELEEVNAFKKQREQEKREVASKKREEEYKKTQEWLEKRQQEKATKAQEKEIQRVEKWKESLKKLEAITNPTKDERRKISNLYVSIANVRKREERRKEREEAEID